MIEIDSSKLQETISLPFGPSWSDKNVIAVPTEANITLIEGGRGGKLSLPKASIFLCLLLLASPCLAGDITTNVFGSETDLLPAAFGDFNSDEYPDLFVIQNGRRRLQILLGSDSNPMLKRFDNLKCDFDREITSVVPSDFDGDGLMDVMVTLFKERPSGSKDEINTVQILWGSLNSINCNTSSQINIDITGQPLVMDYNGDMIMDLFGLDSDKNRTFWVFNSKKEAPRVVPMLENENRKFSNVRLPHSHSFLDLNLDSYPDLYVTTEDIFEVWINDWNNDEFKKFNFDPDLSIKLPESGIKHVGQTLFIDVDLDGLIDHVLPVCMTDDCRDSRIYVYSHNKWTNLSVNFHDGGNIWGFAALEVAERAIYTNPITLHGGDFNMDGYPDLMATLQFGSSKKSFFLRNDACIASCPLFPRTFSVQWKYLSPFNDDTSLGVFYDFANDGVLDIVFYHTSTAKVSAFQNNLDYDSNFLKVVVLSGITNEQYPEVPTPLGKNRKNYGTTFPGPLVSYWTTTEEGNLQRGVATQLPQSAYFSLQLPYALFGLGRTPNFIEQIEVCLAGRNKSWLQIVPNSQLVVIPHPPNDSSQWFAQLFVTPSKIILQTFLALLAICLFISIIILILWWKERRQDHYEKLQASHRFHFDAM